MRRLLEAVALDPALAVVLRSATPDRTAALVRDWLAQARAGRAVLVADRDTAGRRRDGGGGIHVRRHGAARGAGALARGAVPVVVVPSRARPLSATPGARPPLGHVMPPASSVAPAPLVPRPPGRAVVAMRILVIEDDPTVGQFVKRGLEEQQFTVDLESDGEAGERRAGTGESYDVVVLDMRLPGKDGLAVLRTLRSRGFQRPVLVLTAQDAVDAKVQTLRAGADDYVTKPFAFEELLARIEALARRPRQLATRRLAVADLELDLDSREVARAGVPIELTPKEFKVLEYLMRHPGRVMSRTLITEYAWGYHFDPGTNIVDVVITHLRKKVDHGHDRKLIGTVRGVGYVVKE